MRTYWVSISCTLAFVTSIVLVDGLSLTQHQEQLLHDRLFQTNLRGPRWTGNDNQNTLVELVAKNMKKAGLEVQILPYEFIRWDPRWWSLFLTLKNGTTLGLPTTGYWPYSGDTGSDGRTGPLHDAGTYGMIDNLDRTADNSTLNLNGIGQGTILFFDNPSPTRNYSQPEYKLLGTSRDVAVDDIPELGNLTNPHWQSSKKLNWDVLRGQGIVASISSWVHTSDDNGALQYLPNDGAPGNGKRTYDVPSLYVGNSTGERIGSLIQEGIVETATVVLDAPSLNASTSTVIGHLKGRGHTNDTILLYTHSDGPSIIEENGPILLLAMAEALATAGLDINVDFVITTGHMSGGHLDESAWKKQVPSIVRNVKTAIMCEHFGAIEYKDLVAPDGSLVYEATGKLEPMWTLTNDSSQSSPLHQIYLDSFAGTSGQLRMALLSPQVVQGNTARWFGVGGGSQFAKAGIPTLGIIPQPDYLWAAFPDGGWSKLDVGIAVEQINVILNVVERLNAKHVAGEL